MLKDALSHSNGFLVVSMWQQRKCSWSRFCDAATLISVIQRNVLPDTMIWSDERAAYNGLPGVGYPHQTVYHSHHYVDPNTGCQTKNIEALCNTAKSKLKCRFGVPRDALPSYLVEEPAIQGGSIQ
jgi:ISXO2-like transposase domain